MTVSPGTLSLLKGRWHPIESDRWEATPTVGPLARAVLRIAGTSTKMSFYCRRPLSRRQRAYSAVLAGSLFSSPFNQKQNQSTVAL